MVWCCDGALGGLKKGNYPVPLLRVRVTSHGHMHVCPLWLLKITALEKLSENLAAELTFSRVNSI